MKRFLLFAPAISGVVVTVFVLTATALSNSAPSFGELQNRGQAVDLDQLVLSERRQLDEAGVTSDLRLLTERDGVRYYTAKHASGGTCYITGLLQGEAHHFGMLQCPSRDPSADPPAFPSRQLPINDFSLFVLAGENWAPTRVTRFAGFAADAVARVGILDVNGVVHSVPVIDNVYSMAAPPSVQPTALVAMDSSGARIYTLELKANR